MDEMIRNLHNALVALRIRYVVIGGVAASIFGRPRMTVDVDAVIVISQKRLAALLGALRQWSFKIPSASEPRVIDRLGRGLPVKIWYKKRLSVDLRVASYSIDRQALARASLIELFGIPLRVASPEDIIVYKVARFDDLDRADIKAIISRFGKKLDTPYIKEAAEELAEETGDEQIGINLDSVLSWWR